jgi:uncharacterized protein (TIGR02757 family)
MDNSFKGSLSELKEFLDFKAAQYEQAQFIATDPISLAHRYSKKEDIEIVAFLMATIAWGNRQSIIKSGEKLLTILGPSPHEYVLHYNDGECPSFIHRTFNQDDLNGFLLGLQALYRNGGLQNAFKGEASYLDSYILHFRKQFVPFLKPRSHKHVADPSKGSAAKRIVMFLRWMVRSSKNGVDFGLWNHIPLSALHVPLDVHTGNIARKLGLITRKQNDWLTNLELQQQLLAFDPNDPAKYDFALFGLGAFEKF